MSGCMCNCCPLIEVALQHHVPLGLYYYPLSAKGPTNSKRDHLLPSIGHRHTRSGRHLHHQAPKLNAGTQPTAGGSISTPNTYAPTTLNSSISAPIVIFTVLLLPTPWSLPQPSIPTPYGTSLHATVNTNPSRTTSHLHTIIRSSTSTSTTPQHHHLTEPVITILEQHPYSSPPQSSLLKAHSTTAPQPTQHRIPLSACDAPPPQARTTTTPPTNNKYYSLYPHCF